jgi:hypothetical protein
MYVSASVHTNMCGRHVHKARTCMQAAIIKTTCALSRYDAHCYQYRNAISTASSSSDKRTGCYSSAVVIATAAAAVTAARYHCAKRLLIRPFMTFRYYHCVLVYHI